MGKVSVEFDHAVGDTVGIEAINVMGRVDALELDILGKQYRVVYWNDGVRCSVWLYDWEIAES